MAHRCNGTIAKENLTLHALGDADGLYGHPRNPKHQRWVSTTTNTTTTTTPSAEATSSLNRYSTRADRYREH
jgi:hypothetical protein